MKMFSISLMTALLTAVNCSYGSHPSDMGCSTCGPTMHAQTACGTAACGTAACSTCQTCGPSNGDCCFPNEAIDIDSLTDKAQSKRLYEQRQARLIFEVPEDVELILAGQKMTTWGKERSFLVAVNDQKLTYRYDIRVDAVRGGQLYYKKQQVKILKAGAILKVKVEAPKVADGEIPEISMTVEPIMAGGPSAEDKAKAAAAKKLEATPGAPEPMKADLPDAPSL
ncbi:MAG: hypothetical protein ABJZ55_08135 [Fuerstiella sp.]